MSHAVSLTFVVDEPLDTDYVVEIFRQLQDVHGISGGVSASGAPRPSTRIVLDFSPPENHWFGVTVQLNKIIEYWAAVLDSMICNITGDRPPLRLAEVSMLELDGISAADRAQYPRPAVTA